MKQEQIRILIDALAASGLSELEYSEDGCTLRLVKRAVDTAATVAASRTPAGAAVEAHRSAEARPELPAKRSLRASECLAPLYGVVHLQSAPDEPLFVQPGQQVAAGQTLCVIEAMKVFNEVRAEADATIAEVLVRTGDEVESGQPLFRLG